MFGLGRNKAAAASTENKPQVPATFHVFVLEAMKQVLALKEVPRKYPKLKEMAEAARGFSLEKYRSLAHSLSIWHISFL